MLFKRRRCWNWQLVFLMLLPIIICFLALKWHWARHQTVFQSAPFSLRCKLSHIGGVVRKKWIIKPCAITAGLLISLSYFYYLSKGLIFSRWTTCHLLCSINCNWCWVHVSACPLFYHMHLNLLKACRIKAFAEMQMRVCQEVGRQASVYWDRMCTIISDYVQIITTINSGGTKPASSRLQCSNLNKDMINYRPGSEESTVQMNSFMTSSACTVDSWVTVSLHTWAFYYRMNNKTKTRKKIFAPHTWSLVISGSMT